MSENITYKILKEVFKDYNSNSFELVNAKVKSINLFKKTNTLELELISEKHIKIKEIYNFEKYLEIRFNIKNVLIKIENEIIEKNEIENACEGNNEINSKLIVEEWQDIIEYISNKHPMSKAILKNSSISIDGKAANIFLSIKGKEFLIAKKFDEILSNLFSDIYGEKYKVSYIENISEEILQKQREYNQKLQNDIIKNIQEECIKIKEDKENNTNNKESQNNNDKFIEEQTKKSEKIIEEEITPLILGRNINIKEQLTKVIDLSIDSGKIALEGEIINTDERELKNGKHLLMFDLYDGTSTITCKSFVEAEKAKSVMERIKSAKGVKLSGNAQFDPFAKELGVIANVIVETAGVKKEIRMDNSKEKRVELHMHTQMSQMDGITAAQDLIKRAMKWGMKSIAITDHGVVQSFPDAHKMLGYDNPDMKIIYGVEAYLAPDKSSIVSNSKGQDINTTYCVLDLETTGLSFRTEKITEIGVMKYQNGEVIDEFSCFVNPEKPIPQKVVEVTNITDEMVKDAETIDIVMPKLLEFLGDSILVAHNADFDIGFLKYNVKELGLTLENTYIDTLRLSKDLFPDFKKYKLGIIAEKLGIKVDVAHRALDDVDTTVKVFKIMLDMLKEKGVKTVDDIDNLEERKVDYKKLQTYHAIILAKNYVGLKNLYKLVSYSHLDYFYKKPRILKSMYKKYSEGLILGSACEAGELYRAIVAGKDDEEIEEIAKDYDYLEIQPIGNNMFMIRNGTVPDTKALEDINKKIVALGEKLGKLVVATCDVHFMDPQDEIYRRILMAGQRI